MHIKLKNLSAGARQLWIALGRTPHKGIKRSGLQTIVPGSFSDLEGFVKELVRSEICTDDYDEIILTLKAGQQAEQIGIQFPADAKVVAAHQPSG
jgi:hypothetical protein